MANQIIGLEGLQRKLNKLKDFTFVGSVVKAEADRLMGLMKVYPKPPSGSKYKRTHNLQKAWNVKSENSNLRQIIGNDVVSPTGVHYGPYVQDSEMQAWMHQGRWQTDAEVAEQERENVVNAIKQAIDRALMG